ncbi:MAG: response regulator [Thermodesulfobacteriota bacterium]|nr:response regulator [Thermodesulfobacteriota bacterium]
MPSIALFFSKFTNEDQIRDKLASELDLSVVSDEDIINDICNKNLARKSNLEHCLYKKTSVFNKFTLERELNAAHLKFAMAESLMQKQNMLYHGFTSVLIPHEVTHVLKVLIIDNKKLRLQKAAAEGVSEKEADRLIKSSDLSAHDWTNFLYQREAFDPSLFDIVIPVGQKNADEVVAVIKKNFNKTTVLETKNSIQAVKDFALTAQVEHALLSKGQKVGVETHDSHVSLKVNKSAFSFSMLTKKLTSIVDSVPGIKEVQVLRGKEYMTSVYRDQHFELPPKVLLVDDEKEYVETLSERLVARNVGSYAVFDGQEALNFIDGDQPDVMVLDLKMPGINGIEVLKETKKNNPNIEVIILTGHGSEADRKTCMSLGAFAYLQKPTEIEKLSETINAAYQKIAADNAMERYVNPLGKESEGKKTLPA